MSRRLWLVLGAALLCAALAALWMRPASVEQASTTSAPRSSSTDRDRPRRADGPDDTQPAMANPTSSDGTWARNGHVFAKDSRRLGAPSFSTIRDAREAATRTFGAPTPDNSPPNRQRLEALQQVSLSLGWVRNYAASADASYDSAAVDQRLARIRHVLNRVGGPEEIAWALEGVREACEEGLALADVRGRDEAKRCIRSLGEIGLP